jgi:hypothetical protein
MSTAVPKCRIVTVRTFRGDRGAFGKRVRKALEDAKNGRGPCPSMLECSLYTGHTGVSTDSDKTIYGFNPDPGKLPLWQVMQRLRNGDAFPGVVLNDGHVFAAAAGHGLTVLTFDVILPDPAFQDFERKLTAERKRSAFSYGFPNGDGDCNCTTWLERLALPLLTGSMEEFPALRGFVYHPSRRFGECV